MDHSNKQVLLFGIWEKFDIPLPTTVADHGKAGYFISVTGGIFHFYESPVHLVCFSRCRMVTSTTVALRGYKLSFRGDKFLMCYPAFYLVLNHTTFNQIKKRHSINYSDGFYIGLLYAVPLVLS